MAQHLAREGYATHSNGTYVHLHHGHGSANFEKGLTKLTFCRLADLKGAIDKSDALQQDNKSRWPPHGVAGKGAEAAPALKLWDIAPVEVQREQTARMAND